MAQPLDILISAIITVAPFAFLVWCTRRQPKPSDQPATKEERDALDLTREL